MKYALIDPPSCVAPDMGSIIEALKNEIDLSDRDEFSVKFMDDDEIRDLNKQFRGKDTTTNVLSFPADEDDYLGDIAISMETITREAQEQGKSLQDHLTHMLVHAILHLLGYDHIEDDEAEEMETLEVRILSCLGIKNPYI